MSLTLKPYPEYKDSGLPWLGSVPAHWQRGRIKNLFRESEARSGTGEGVLLSLTRLRGLIPHSTASSKLPSAVDLTKYKACKAGQLVMNRMQAWSGMFAYASLDGLVSPDYSVFTRIGELDVPYFEELFKSPRYVQQFALASKGIGSGFNRLYTPEFSSISVEIPPIVEQRQISDFIGAFSGRIRKLIKVKRRAIELLNEQKQAIVDSILGVEARSSESRPTRLKYVASVQTGVTLGKRYDAFGLISRPYLRVANVQNGFLDLRTIKTIDVPKAEVQSSSLCPGDVLMTEGGDIDKLGRGCVWQGEINDCLHQNHIFAVRTFRQRLDPEFLSLLMTSHHGRDYFQSTAKQTTNLASTNQTTIRNFPFPLPTVVEQQDIVGRVAAQVSAINQSNDRVAKEIDFLREYRTRLIADVVTGKADVRGVELQELNEVEEVSDAEDEELEDSEELEVAEDA